MLVRVTVKNDLTGEYHQRDYRTSASVHRFIQAMAEHAIATDSKNTITVERIR